MYVHTSYYDNGQIRFTVSINSKGNFEGEYKEWHENGQLRVQTTYKNGKQHGEYKDWYSNGQLWNHQYKDNGSLHGEDKCWKRNGSLFLKNYWKHGKRQGITKLYDIDATINIYYIDSIIIDENFHIFKRNIWLKFKAKLKFAVNKKKYGKYLDHVPKGLDKLCLSYL